LKDSKENHKSKRKTFMISFGTVLGIFSLTLFGPTLVAVAKDIPKVIPKVNPNPPDIASVPPPSTTVCPAPPAPVLKQTKELLEASLSASAMAVCGSAAKTGSRVAGGFCFVLIIIIMIVKQGN
jgi:hypothetical protein